MADSLSWRFADRFDGQRDSRPPLPASWAESLPVAPDEDGAAILAPRPDEAPGPDSGDLRHPLVAEARREVLELAASWTADYRDLPAGWKALAEDPDAISATRFFLTGHQATLFHPGVWFKNFVLDRLARRSHGVAIHLVIDDEPVAMPGVRTPVLSNDETATWYESYYDEPESELPGDLRRLRNPDLFASFGKRLGAAVRSHVTDPLVVVAWKQVTGLMLRTDRLPHLLAAVRHRFEAEIGLQTLELPLSRLCESEAFARFAAEVLVRGAEFARIYNDVLDEFRNVAGIRRPNHPVPPLATNGATELPFWIYSSEDPVRRRVHVEGEGKTIRLFAPGFSREWRTGPDQLSELIRGMSAAGICFRPRALLTTLLARMLLADQFVHGIGGSLYDRLSDRIAGLFWGLRLPGFLTATGTWRWIPWNAARANERLQRGRQLLRELEQQPERHVDPAIPESARLVEAKRALLARMGEPTGRRERQQEMEQVNAELRRRVEPLVARLVKEVAETEAAQARNQILGSREIAWVAHSRDLPERLAAAADRLVGPA